jgi:hypothetical protein
MAEPQTVRLTLRCSRLQLIRQARVGARDEFLERPANTAQGVSLLRVGEGGDPAGRRRLGGQATRPQHRDASQEQKSRC